VNAAIAIGFTFLFQATKPAVGEPAAMAPSGPYCGIYCLYAAMRLDGHELEVQSLMNPRYIGSGKGSTVEELQGAAIDNGMHALPISQLTTDSLRATSYRIILHVKGNRSAEKYDHWLLYVGNKDGMAIVLDPPNDPQLISFGELAAQWDGNGLIVSATPIDVSSVTRPNYLRFTIYVLLGAGGLGLAHLIRSKRAAFAVPQLGPFAASLVQSTTLLACTGAAALAYHRFAEEGMLRQTETIAGIQRAHFDGIAKLNYRNVQSLDHSKTILVDARFPADYQAGHLDGAINIPVNTNDDARRKAFAAISKDKQIVLYCQSAGCPFAGKVAAQLAADGYSNLAIFKGGWLEWRDHNPQAPSTQRSAP